MLLNSLSATVVHEWNILDEYNYFRILAGFKQQQLLRWAQPLGHNRHGPKSEGAAVPFLGGGAGSLSNTMSPGPSPTSLPSGIMIHPAIWLHQTWAEIGGVCAVSLWGSWVPI